MPYLRSDVIYLIWTCISIWLLRVQSQELLAWVATGVQIWVHHANMRLRGLFKLWVSTTIYPSGIILCNLYSILMHDVPIPSLTSIESRVAWKSFIRSQQRICSMCDRLNVLYYIGMVYISWFEYRDLPQKHQFSPTLQANEYHCLISFESNLFLITY